MNSFNCSSPPYSLTIACPIGSVVSAEMQLEVALVVTRLSGKLMLLQQVPDFFKGSNETHSSNDKAHRRGRPATSELASAVARPRSVERPCVRLTWA